MDLPISILVDDVLEGLAVDRVDILVAGPPCQGNSNLNNITRRSDSRNELLCICYCNCNSLEFKIVIIENVPEVGVSDQNVVMRSRNTLQKYGYSINRERNKTRCIQFWNGTIQKRHLP